MTPEQKQKLDIIAQAALSTIPTLHFSFEAAEACIAENIPGDFVECGVFAGAQCAAMAIASQENGADRRIHLFDSFEGIPDAGPHDDPRLSGESVSSLENTKKFMRLWEIDESRLVYHKGWFEDTTPIAWQVADLRKIAILRLDGDLYSSTSVCISYLYPALSPGGFCIIDDYQLAGCRLAVREYLAINKFDVDIIPIEGGNGPAYFRKP